MRPVYIENMAGPIQRIAANLIHSRLAHIIAGDTHNATSRSLLLSAVHQAVVQAAGENAFYRMIYLVLARLIRNPERTTI